MTKEYMQIEENSDLVRETSSHAVINTNKHEFKLAKERRKKRLMQEERLNTLEDKVDRILELLEKK